MRKHKIGHGSHAHQMKLQARWEAKDPVVGLCTCGRFIITVYEVKGQVPKHVVKCRLCSFKKARIRTDLQEFIRDVAPALRGCEALCKGKHADYIKALAIKAAHLKAKYNCG